VAEAGVAAVLVRNTASHDARVLRCARTLRSLGYEAVVIGVTSEEETEERSLERGLPIVRLSPQAPLAGLAKHLRWRPAAVSRTYRLLRTLSYYRHGIAAMRRLRPRIVHCNDYNTMWIGVGAKLLAGSALIYDSHELWPDRNGRSEPRWWLLACEALFLRIADGILATSPGHAEAIARRHRVAPPRVVRNVVERPSRNGAGRDTGEVPAGDRQTIVYVGALTGGRGLEQAIAALPWAPDVALRLLGPGNEPYREHLALHADAHGVRGRVLLSTPVPPQRVVEEIAQATAGVALIQPACLSYELSLPNKVFEYLAAGLPILASDVPVIAELVERYGVGLVVAPDDPEAIAAAMTAIVEPRRNDELRAAARETSARLSWEREAEGLVRTYREAVTAGGRQ
jgi:glycosyltransferase involved in cell wall biosynthesis